MDILMMLLVWFVGSLGVLWIVHIVIELGASIVDGFQLRRETVRELSQPTRVNARPAPGRAQNASELKLQRLCVKLAARLGIPPPAVYVCPRVDATGAEAMFETREYTIYFSPTYYKGHRSRHTRRVLKHELVHAWSFVRGKPLDHGFQFEDKARLFGAQ